MASRRAKSISAVAIVAIGAGGWFLYNALAAQAQGGLAQAPLNNQVQVPPAFVMALDNSGSMRTDETLFRTSNGRGYFSTSTLSFFNVLTGALLTSGTAVPFLHMTDDNWNADTYAPLRSPEFNRAFFNPHSTYTPWLKGDESNDAPSTVTAAAADPRGSCAPSRCASYTTYDFTTTRTVTESWRNGSVMPAGTWLYNNATCNQAPGSTETQYAWIQLTADKTFTESCPTQFRYYPARVYLTVDAPPPPGYDLSKRVLIKGVGKPVGVVKTDMYRYDYIASNFTTGGAEAAQNFANWWTYYGNRNRAMIAGITNGLKGLSNMRVASFPFVNPPALSSNLTMYDMGSPTEKATLINQVRALNAGGGSTPSRRGTAYMIRQFHRTDGGAPIKYQCQRNAAMLFTDGYTNESSQSAVTSYFDVGDQDLTLGAPYGGLPYSGGVASQNTIADYAMWGYLTNPRPDLPTGGVPLPAGCPGAGVGSGVDCNRNLHVNFYGVTLGAIGQIYDVNEAATNDPYANPPSWTATSSTNLNPANVDDIWHAALNARGEYINANTPKDITDAMRRILQKVSSGASPSGSIAMAGARISARSLSVVPSYEIRNEGTDWFSRLSASRIAIDPDTRLVTETNAWEASDRLASTPASARATHTWYGHAGGASQFNTSNITNLDVLCSNPAPMSRCSSAEITSRLGIDAAAAVNYLLGETSREVRLGGTLRDRTTLLGDIVNSSPVVSAPTDDYGYRALPSPYGGSSYNTYMTAKQSRPAMVYVGANAGMLHAFHGGIDHLGTVDAANGGREQFAFIPRAVLGHMGNLLYPYVAADGGDQKFDHRYFVDGPVTVSDAYYGGSWKTVLVGTTGAGGRSVFGLNVSNPTGFNGATHRLWEVDDQHPTVAVRDNIGHVLGKPVIVPVKSGATVAWKAIFGNGYNSKNGNAVLYVVDIQTGVVQITQAIEPGAPATGTNGLGNIVVVDRWGGTGMTANARDGYADTVYAADQKGAIWKFDLRTMAASINTPVFTTQEQVEAGVTYRQPIIGGLTATAGRGAGVMLLFGTGSFSFVNDASDDSVQSIYGVLDTGAAGTRTRTNLQQQTILVSTDDTRTISNTGVTLGTSGWYLDLPAGERSVGYPRVASGVLFIPTYAPSIADGCSTQGMNWLYGLNTRTGGPMLAGVRFGSTTGEVQGAGVGALALDTTGSAPVKDVGLTVLSRSAPPNPGVVGPPDDGCWMRVTVPGMVEAMFVPYPCGRQSWRQIE